MSFEIRDSYGRKINSIEDMFKQIQKDAISAGIAHVTSNFNTFAKQKTMSLRCHGLPVKSVQTDHRDGGIKAVFDVCCDELRELAESTVSAALERKEFGNT